MKTAISALIATMLVLGKLCPLNKMEFCTNGLPLRIYKINSKLAVCLVASFLHDSFQFMPMASALYSSPPLSMNPLDESCVLFARQPCANKSDSDLTILCAPSIQSLDEYWWEKEAEQIFRTTQDLGKRRLASWLVPHHSPQSRPCFRLNWSWISSFNSLDAGGIAEAIDRQICAALCKISFEDWVRTALYPPCGSVKRLVKEASFMRDELEKCFGKLPKSHDLFEMVEKASLSIIYQILC